MEKIRKTVRDFWPSSKPKTIFFLVKMCMGKNSLRILTIFHNTVEDGGNQWLMWCDKPVILLLLCGVFYMCFSLCASVLSPFHNLPYCNYLRFWFKTVHMRLLSANKYSCFVITYHSCNLSGLATQSVCISQIFRILLEQIPKHRKLFIVKLFISLHSLQITHCSSRKKIIWHL